jgi:hypothetical protein
MGTCLHAVEHYDRDKELQRDPELMRNKSFIHCSKNRYMAQGWHWRKLYMETSAINARGIMLAITTMTEIRVARR